MQWFSINEDGVWLSWQIGQAALLHSTGGVLRHAGGKTFTGELKGDQTGYYPWVGIYLASKYPHIVFTWIHFILLNVCFDLFHALLDSESIRLIGKAEERERGKHRSDSQLVVRLGNTGGSPNQ